MRTSLFPQSLPQRTGARRHNINQGDDEFLHFETKFASNRSSFFRAASPVVKAAQYFALLPVYGITGVNSSALRFKWLSVRTFYSVLMAASYTVAFCFSSNRFFSTQFTFSNIAQVIFFLYACGINMMFLSLATRWPHIIRQWEVVELQMRGYGYPRTLSRKVRAITVAMITLAALEHVFANVSKVQRGLLCSHGGTDWLRAYFVNNYYHVFALTRYSLWKALPTLYVNVVATFTWTYADLFLIVVSISITERFRRIDHFLCSVRGQDLSQRLWGKVRRDYNRVTQLTALLDSYISNIVLLSFGNNMYFICLQLNYSLSLSGWTYEAAYFYASLTFIVFRAYTVLFCAASVYEESKKPRKVLQSVPSRSYCLEVERFLFHVSCHEVTFTGLKLFSVNRKLILTVFSAVITYQIVLIQMNASSTYEYSIPPEFNASRDCLQ